MDSKIVIDFFALTVILGGASLAIGLVVPAIRPIVRDAAPIIASVVAIGATLGSLYLSEEVGLVPCRLCWFQRIGMYPLAVLLPIAAVVGPERGIRIAAAILASAGALVSIYHVQLQWFPDQSSGACDASASCTDKIVDALGFMSIPQMALACFAMIGVMLITMALATIPNPSPDPRIADQ